MFSNKQKLAFWQSGIRAKARLILQNPRNLLFYLRYYLGELNSSGFDLSIVSLPKSGRTWLEEMILVGAKLHVGDVDPAANSYRFLSAKHRTLPRIYFTHAGMGWETNVISSNELTALEPSSFVKNRAILLYRDPRDNLVSTYYHIKYRTGHKNFSTSDVIHSDLVGLPKIVAFMNMWMDYARRHEDSVMLLSYEMLRKETKSSMRRVFDFVGIMLSDSQIDQAIDECRFDRMQAREKGGTTNNPWLTAVNRSDVRTYKVRSGKIGEYAELFSADEQLEIDKYIRERLDPAFGYLENGYDAGKASRMA